VALHLASPKIYTMILERKSVSGQRNRSLAVGLWVVSVLLVQSTVGVDLARDVSEGEQRLELRIHERRDPPSGAVAPSRTNEESIDPWELVSV
jgi:hypothetical protein